MILARLFTPHEATTAALKSRRSKKRARMASIPTRSAKVSTLPRLSFRQFDHLAIASISRHEKDLAPGLPHGAACRSHCRYYSAQIGHSSGGPLFSSRIKMGAKMVRLKRLVLSSDVFREIVSTTCTELPINHIHPMRFHKKDVPPITAVAPVKAMTGP